MYCWLWPILRPQRQHETNQVVIAKGPYLLHGI